jgi:FkbM family methyltransferase
MSFATRLLRARQLWRRRKAAQRLGIEFRRAATFRLPLHIRLHGLEVPLSIPDEHCQRIAFIELLLDDCYGLKRLAERRSIQTVLDVGANVGLFGLAARAAFPQARIHAYEPNHSLEPLLAHHSRLVGAEYFLQAIGQSNGFVSLDTDMEQSVLTTTRPDLRGDVRQVAFSEALERLGDRVDLVKLDCEGAEWEILKDRASWARVAHVTMEYHLGPGQPHESIVWILDQLGFEVTSLRPVSNFGLAFASRRES